MSGQIQRLISPFLGKKFIIPGLLCLWGCEGFVVGFYLFVCHLVWFGLGFSVWFVGFFVLGHEGTRDQMFFCEAQDQLST